MEEVSDKRHVYMIKIPTRTAGRSQGPLTASQCSIQLTVSRVGQNHTFIGIYGVHAIFLAGKSPYTQSQTVQIYGSGQP